MVSRPVARGSLASEAPEQRGEPRSVGVGDGDEFQPKPLTRGRVAYDGVGSDLSLGDEKLKVGRSPDLAWRRRSQE
jgi:hypothetical protein